MDYSISNIHLSIEKQGIDHIDYTKENTDVIVELDNGAVYMASFITYAYFKDAVIENKKSKAFAGGRYFWVESMVLVQDCSIETVRDVIGHVIEEGDFERVFQKV